MILETIITTINSSGDLNIAPMGPFVPDEVCGPQRAELDRFDLKPFSDSSTYQNLHATKAGVLHVVDDVELFARSAIGTIVEADYATIEATAITGRILTAACRAYEFEVDFVTPDAKRPVLKCSVKSVHRFRDFWGFNRAKHAVIETAILATRIGFLPTEQILKEVRELSIKVEKTGGEIERRAFTFLVDYISEQASVAHA